MLYIHRWLYVYIIKDFPVSLERSAVHQRNLAHIYMHGPTSSYTAVRSVLSNASFLWVGNQKGCSTCMCAWESRMGSCLNNISPAKYLERNIFFLDTLSMHKIPVHELESRINCSHSLYLTLVTLSQMTTGPLKVTKHLMCI